VERQYKFGEEENFLHEPREVDSRYLELSKLRSAESVNHSLGR